MNYMDEYKKWKEQDEKDAQCGIWLVSTKGGPNQPDFEIAVVRANNVHGFNSYGWFDPNDKRLISHSGGPCSWPIDDQETWDDLVSVANQLAIRLNKKE